MDDAPDVVRLETTSYKNALEAYKAAIDVLTRAEGSVLDTPSHELQEIREAKISVELHLADTLSCLGYCHDSKLEEHERSLMAYRESLSLYIRHVGRFHRTVSNALHNMGAIHVELGQWREASSCFRQCLAILRRRMERERGQQVAAERSQMFVTLQSLGNSLAELREYDASVACFQEIINKSETAGEGTESDSNNPDEIVGEVLSQMARVHLDQASRLSRAFNWQCHVSLFTEGESKKDEDHGSILARQLRVEQNAADCIRRSIHSGRNACYAAETKEAEADGGPFSSLDKDGGDQPNFSAVDEEPTPDGASPPGVSRQRGRAAPSPGGAGGGPALRRRAGVPLALLREGALVLLGVPPPPRFAAREGFER